MFLLQEKKNLIILASQMCNLQKEAFMNDLNKLNTLKVYTIKFSNIVSFLVLTLCPIDKF